MPEWSILGPLLFIILFMIWLKTVIMNRTYFVHADDAKLFRHNTCNSDRTIEEGIH